jgi:MFS-type transporter involved in bile tolerance (Atg22 family)
MNLLIVYALACIAVGLLARRFGRRQELIISLMAIACTALYFFLPARMI